MDPAPGFLKSGSGFLRPDPDQLKNMDPSGSETLLLTRYCSFVRLFSTSIFLCREQLKAKEEERLEIEEKYSSLQVSRPKPGLASKMPDSNSRPLPLAKCYK